MLEKRLKLWQQLGIEALQKEITKSEKQLRKLENKLLDASDNTFTGSAKFRSSFFKAQNKVDVERRYLAELKEVHSILSKNQ